MSETLNEQMEREAKGTPKKAPKGGVGLLGIGAVLAIVFYGAALFIPQSIPLLDANRQALAESPREGFCGGYVMMNTRGRGSFEQMTECMDERSQSTDKDWDSVQKFFCEGIYAAAQFPKDECMTITLQNKFWPTLQGTITNSWNKRFPYPGQNALDAGIQDDSRTGDRDINDRIGDTR